MTTYGYIRVSTLDQNTEKNKLDMIKFANDKKLGNVEFTEEKVTGRKHFNERKLGKLLNSMQEGDILIIPEFTRLARSTLQILEVINITKQRGIILYSLKENFCNNGDDISAKVISTILALLAEIDRELISLRTREALYAKKRSGVKLGRPHGKGKSKLDKHNEDILKLVALNVPKTIIARQYHTSTVNLHGFLRHYRVA